jgi:hypothetical protein
MDEFKHCQIVAVFNHDVVSRYHVLLALQQQLCSPLAPFFVVSKKSSLSFLTKLSSSL